MLCEIILVRLICSVRDWLFEKMSVENVELPSHSKTWLAWR